MIIKYSDGIMKHHGKTIFNYIEEPWIDKAINYVINSKYRKSIKLSSWLKNQVDTISEELYQYAARIPHGKDYDEQMINILYYVKRNTVYMGDNASSKIGEWKMAEYWQTADETILANTGDCEDGSILIYVLARLKGIPANRLMLFAGWVQSSKTAPKGGHCWLGYKSKNYPHNFTFIDWSYYPTLKSIKTRSQFYINNKNIIEYYFSFSKSYKQIDNSKYKSIWFAFNEDVSMTRLNNVY